MTKKQTFIHYTTPLLLSECILAALPFINLYLCIFSILIHIALIIKFKNKTTRLILTLGLLCFIFQYSRISLEEQSRLATIQTFQEKNDQIITIEGVITEPCFKDSENKVTLTIPENNWKVKVYLKDKKCNKHLTYGSNVIVSGKFNAYFKSRNPGQFNPVKYAFQKKEAGKLFIKQYKITGKQLLNPFKWLAYKIKPILLNQHQKALPQPYSDLYTGLIFGVHGTNLPLLLKEQFRRVGLLHALVVSGSQVSLLIGIILFFLNKSTLKKELQWTLLSLICITFYFLTGGGTSIARSILMNLIAYTLLLMNHKTSKIHILSFTALMMILTDPFSIYDYGAQLSFLATTALLFAVPKVEKSIPKQVPSLFRKLIALSITPTIYTTPLIWYCFNNLAPVSIFSNIILLEIIECLVVIGFFSTIAGFIQFDIANVFHQISLTALQTMTKIVSLLDIIPYGSFFTVKPHIGVIILFYSALFVFISDINHKRNIIKIITLLVICSYSFQVLTHSSQKLTILDVGQGDAAVIESKYNKTILIDAGPRRYSNAYQPYYDVAKTVILPFLRHKGINSIDVLFITHFDLDHYGGLISLAQSIPIKLIIHNGNGNNYTWFKKLTEKYKIKTKVMKKNDIISINNHLTFYCLNSANEQNSKKNNQSLVLKAVINNTSILFTGDIHKKIENKLLLSHSQLLDSDILKVAHHGSKTSSSLEFIKQVSPEHCIISAGIKNRYKHPHPRTYQVLQNHCKHVYSTQEKGAVEFKLD